MIIGSSVGAAILLIATIVSCVFMGKGKKKYFEKGINLGEIFKFMSCFCKNYSWFKQNLF